MPSRLLKLTRTKASLTARLIQTNTLSTQIEYAALNHVWKGAKVSRLLAETETQFQQALPIRELPKTFSDAIEITLNLGLEYLWIDAICIIQDSRTDFEQEFNIMGSIYQNCACQIAALDAEDSDAGCFGSRNPLGLRVCKVERSDLPSLYLDRTSGAFDIRDRRWSGSALPPLLKRGWVYQERLLAPRTIHYRKDMLSWECLECSATELDCHLRPYSEIMFNGYSPKRDFNNLILGTLVTKSINWRWLWWDIVCAYSRCALTKESDRWKAIDGCARQIETRYGVEFTAGLSRNYFVEDLLWSTVKPKGRLNILYPSWSWLSIWGSVHNTNAYHNESVLLGRNSPGRDSYIKLLSLEALGGISIQQSSECVPLGWLGATVRGRLKPLVWRKTRDPNCDYKTRIDMVLSASMILEGHWNTFEPDAIEEGEQNDEAHALQLEYTWSWSEDREVLAEKGIVLVPIILEGCSRLLWRRIGLFRMDSRFHTGKGKGVSENFTPEDETVVIIV
jgi:Heterokaryon incompatibility protein (HET)